MEKWRVEILWWYKQNRPKLFSEGTLHKCRESHFCWRQVPPTSHPNTDWRRQAAASHTYAHTFMHTFSNFSTNWHNYKRKIKLQKYLNRGWERKNEINCLLLQFFKVFTDNLQAATPSMHFALVFELALNRKIKWTEKKRDSVQG